MKFLNWKMLWVLLLILLLITACPKTGSKEASFTLNLTEAAPGTVVIASLKNMSSTGAKVSVAQKSAQVVSTSADTVSFKIPNVGNDEFGVQKVVIQSAGKTASNTIKIIHAKFALDRDRTTHGEKITGTVRGIVLEGAKVSVAGKQVAIKILSSTKFTFLIPQTAPVDVQQVRLEPKNGPVLTQGIEILGNVVKKKVSVIINPAKVSQAKALLKQLGFTLSSELKDLGSKGACSSKYAEIDIGSVSLGQALETLKALEEDGILLHIDPVTEWDTGGQSIDHLAAIGARRAHARNIYGTGVMIAILDTGVSKHVEIEARLRTDLGYNFVANNNKTNDDFDDPTTVYKKDGHGTPIAILAAGYESGVAPEAEIMPVKVCDAKGICLSSNVILGVCHALEKAPDRKKLVLNLSLGGDTKVRALEAILRYALDEGVLVAAAAGNKGLDGSPTHYPAAFLLEGLVSVASLKPENSYWVPSDFSTRGKYVDIAAPGEFIRSGSPSSLQKADNIYSGTSFATPLVAGALALWRSVEPKMSPADIEQGLKESATDLTKIGCSKNVCIPEAVGVGVLNLINQPKK